MWLPTEIRKYTKNNKPIPFGLFLKYKDEYNSNKKVLIQCEECNKDIEMVWNRLKENNYEHEICWKCVAKKGRNLQVPIELQNKGTKENPLNYEVYLKYKDSYPKGCKKWIEIRCIECDELKLVQWRKIANRIYSKDMSVCNDCIQKFKANLLEVRRINSEAQKIAQNRPETIIKRNKSVKIACNTENMKKIRKLNMKKLWNNESFRKKMWTTRPTLKGYYNAVRFDSSYELSTLVHFGEKITRSEDVIPYFYNGEWHNYFPDFVLEINNSKILLEIKGAHNNLVDIKKEYALEYIKSNDYDDYWILYREDLLKISNFKLLKKDDIPYIKDLVIKNYPKSWIIKENKL